MRTHRKVLLSLGLGVLGGAMAFAQNVISAKAGLVHLVEGDVYLNDQVLTPKVTEFPDVKDNQILRTEIGRAEVLLSPGVTLRMGENASFKMLSNKLADTRIEVLSGESILEVTEFLKDNTLTVTVNGLTMVPKKAGIYRIDGNPGQIRVYEGEAEVASAEKTWKLGSSRALVASAGNAWTAEKFDNDIGDPLYRWAKRRSGYLAVANVSAANSSRASMYTNYSGWIFNPYFGMYTYVPYRDMIYSPFGYAYFTPSSVYMAFWAMRNGAYNNGYVNNNGGGGTSYSARTPVFDSNRGYSVTGGRSYGGGYGGGSMGGGYSGGSAGAVSAPAASAPAGGGSVRGGSESVGRGGSAGGRGQ